MSADTLCWTNIPVRNLDRAIKFYSAVQAQRNGGADKWRTIFVRPFVP